MVPENLRCYHFLIDPRQRFGEPLAFYFHGDEWEQVAGLRLEQKVGLLDGKVRPITNLDPKNQRDRRILNAVPQKSGVLIEFGSGNLKPSLKNLFQRHGLQYNGIINLF